ncbi:MAG: hypothetical protein LBC80_08590 [Treponema sp.]|jgi:hypothetical protein|nr:hypothetical protein [Treponema sp.]
MKQTRKRLFIDAEISPSERAKTIYLAVENGCNTLVFSFNDKFFSGGMKRYKKLINTYALNIEAGGRDLPLLLPKKLFLSNRELFRMEQGVRKKDHHFCPTNPQTTQIISENAHKWFERILEKTTSPRILHIYPEEHHENTWCACPACRAFSPAEQYLIAANTVADTLVKFDLDARLYYLDFDNEPDAEGISPRKNMIACTDINTPGFFPL